MNSKIETPLNIGIGLCAFHTTRSKKLINFLSDLNVSANYNKIISIKKNIFDAVLEKKKQKKTMAYLFRQYYPKINQCILPLTTLI